MTDLVARLITHLEAISGQRPEFSPRPVAKLPLFLRERYQLLRTTIFGRPFLLAVEQGDSGAGSPGEYAGHSEALRHQLGEPVVFVLPALPSHGRNRMVRLGVPFIVPGSQIFLPTAVIDLRERFPLPKPPAGKPLTPAAQCVVLYHLQREPLGHLPLRTLAEKIGYSPIMLTKVKDELEAAGLCTPTRQGRAVTLAFKSSKRDMWDKAFPFLSSPVKKTHWIHWETRTQPALFAGLTALAQLTHIADDRAPTFALAAPEFLTRLAAGEYRLCPGPDEANIRVQSWSYRPELLGGAMCVDPLSLYLSLRPSTDERVQQQLETLIKMTPW